MEASGFFAAYSLGHGAPSSIHLLKGEHEIVVADRGRRSDLAIGALARVPGRASPRRG